MNHIVGQVVIINDSIDKSYPGRVDRKGHKGMVIQKYLNEDDGLMYVDIQFKYELYNNESRILNQGCFLLSEVTDL